MMKILFLSCFLSSCYCVSGSTYLLLKYPLTLNDGNLLTISKQVNYSRPIKFGEDPRLFQGDIVLSAAELELIKLNISVYRNAITDENLLWPEGIIYYTVSSDFNPDQLGKIYRAMAHIMEETCVRFVNWNDFQSPHGHYVHIHSEEEGCFSWIGFRPTEPGIPQYINLGRDGCFDDFGTAEHEILHALGLDHEQNRPDRDTYLKILPENVMSGMEFNFNLNPTTTTFDLPYDFGSVMQYQNDAFSVEPGLPTMISRTDPRICLGQRHQATQCDLEKIRKLYGCRVQNNCVPRIQMAHQGHCMLYV